MGMHVLVIGGTRFVGRLLTWRLLARGHRVTHLNRGTRPTPFGTEVDLLRADRTSEDFARVLQGRRFDACVDFAAFDAPDVLGAIGHVRCDHYVFISSGQVYLVREGAPFACRETDYEGALIARPTTAHDEAEWSYGVKKRAAEDALARAWSDIAFPSTRLRIPMVNGENDYRGRIARYLEPLARGDRLILPDAGQTPMRHVYADDVARAIVSLLGDESTFGEAYNLAQDETPTLAELVELLAEQLGTRARTEVLSTEQIVGRGLDVEEISPFSTRWMSFLETSKAKYDLAFRPTPLREQLARITAAWLAHGAAD
jgi:nucleoside-diphosphate-sugar epimerase